MTALELSWVCSYIAISINVTHSCFTFVPVYVVVSKCILICVSYFIKAKTSDITLSLPKGITLFSRYQRLFFAQNQQTRNKQLYIIISEIYISRPR